MKANFTRSAQAMILALLPTFCGIDASNAAQDGALIVAQSAAPQAPKLFHGVGIVTAIDAKSGVISLNHEAIPGLMDAMEMQYEAKPAKLIEGLAVGDKVGFTVDGKTLAILDAKKLPSAK